jgi:AraC family transcriptional regulator
MKAAGHRDVPAFSSGPSQELSGEVLRKRIIGPFTLTECALPAGSALGRHFHDESHLTFVIAGSLREKYASGAMTCRTGSVRFLPEREAHEVAAEAVTRCLHVISDASVFEQLDRKAAVPRKPTKIDGLAATWLANRLYAEFSREDSPSALAIEGLLLEIFAEMARSETMPDRDKLPGWLRRATDIVEERFLERLSLSAIATEVGVHYVHLSRQFHKYNRCTIGDLIRKRRVQYASHLLAHTDTPLAEIALTCGFSDQSHLSFLFKRYMGLSPSKFRSLLGRQVTPEPAQASE